MDINKFHISLRNLYNDYNEIIKPLIAEIESRDQVFPVPVFNEIRAFNDHIAQCFISESDQKKIDEEIHKAGRHINRIIKDCFKYLAVSLFEKIKIFEHQTKKVDLTLINNNEFYIKYRNLKTEAESKIREAKKIESTDNGKAFTLFQEAYNSYCNLETLIEKNENLVNWARKKHYLGLTWKTAKWLLASIISGIVALAISCNMFWEQIKKLIF